jgi:HAD superfamily hydrolase (TIGR01549 family)
VEKVLQSLKQGGKRIGIISNMDPRLENILQEAGLRHYFEFVIASYEARCFKPQVDIFKLALEKYSKECTKPVECCHIGDSYNEDYLGKLIFSIIN